MQYHIKDFLNDEQGVTFGFVKAVQSLEAGDTLCLDGGVYHLYPEGAYHQTYYISNNDAGDKPIAMPLIGKKNIIIDGGGAELIFHGKMLPFVIDGSSDVTIRDLSIDYHTPFYAQAKILSADKEGILLAFDGKEFQCRVSHGNFCFFSTEDDWEWEVLSPLSLEFDELGLPSPYAPPFFPCTGKDCDHGFLSGMVHHVALEEKAPNLIMMHTSMGQYHHAGCYLIMTFATREYPGIFVTDSQDITLSDIRLYHTAAMGVIAQMTENISLCRVVAKPREGSGRMLCVNADATHFVNCRGKITQTGCVYEQMMDDAANIHGIYHLYQAQNDDGSLSLGFGHFQQKGIQPYRVGDSVAVIDSQTNQVKAQGCVLEATLISPDEVRLVLDVPVPLPGAYDVVENLSTAPHVHFDGCKSGYNRPRGFLISSSGKVLVENCHFYNMNQGIQLAGEMRDWYESGCVKDVTIRHCVFRNSAYAGGVAIRCDPMLRCDKTIFNHRVVIEDNTFVQSTKRICHVASCQEVVFVGNRYVCDPMLPQHPTYDHDGVYITNCCQCQIEDITEVI